MDLFAGEQQRLVYLTADSDTELAQLDPQVCAAPCLCTGHQ